MIDDDRQLRGILRHMNQAYKDVLEFWFQGDPTLARREWFVKDPAFDASIRERFTPLMDAAQRGELVNWEAAPESTLALVILCDQFPRNVYRGTPKAFEFDGIARHAAGIAVERGDDRTMTPHQRAFLYLPFEHSENIDDQLRAVELFTRLAGEAPRHKMYLEYAIAHKDVIEKFERFPHRNEILGRASTPEEIAFLITNPGF